jgi:ABC-type hemin transport system substrate-binding protein
MKSLKATGRSCVWNVVENFHTNTPTTTSTIQNSTRFNVEFTLSLRNRIVSRLPRLPCGPSATEVVFALGAGDSLVGVTHEVITRLGLIACRS